MADPTSTQVRRPSEHAELMEKLLRGERPGQGGAFRTYRDEMVFAAAVGWSFARRSEFASSVSPIEWSVMVNGFGAEQLVDLIAFSESDDPEILVEDQLPRRIRIFESYANGGLEIISELIQKEALTPAEAVYRLVSREFSSQVDDLDDSAPDIRALEKELGLD